MNIKAIKNVLPHGSGINYDWEIGTNVKRLYFYNKYDYMDENGFYDDIFPFVVCFENGVFKYLHFLGCTRKQYKKIERAYLRDYLETMFIETEEKIKELL